MDKTSTFIETARRRNVAMTTLHSPIHNRPSKCKCGRAIQRCGIWTDMQTITVLLDVAEAAQEWKESERAVEDVSTFGASDMAERLHRRRLATHGLFAVLGKIPQDRSPIK